MIITSFTGCSRGESADGELATDGAGIRSRRGAVDLVTLDGGGWYVVDAEAGDAAAVVVDGAVELDGRVVERDSLVHIGHGSNARLRAVASGTRLCALRGHVTITEPEPFSRTIRADDVALEAAHAPERGFFHMAARRLVSGGSGGHRAFTVGMSTFEAGRGRHALHRHAHAEEFFLVLDGHGAHLTGDGELPVSPGDLACIPTGQWHGFRAATSSGVRALFGYLGVDVHADAGYEIAENIEHWH